MGYLGCARFGIATALDLSLQSAARYLRAGWHGSWDTPTRGRQLA